MAVVPRIHDGLMLRREGDRWRVHDPSGADCGWLGEAGRFIVLRLDGLTERDALLDAYALTFGEPLGSDELDAIVQRLEKHGLINTNPRALEALRYLAEKGVRYRTADRDRRVDGTREDGRRGVPGSQSASWDHGVYLVNEGYLEPAMDVFRELRSKHPTDLRVQTLIGHLEYLLKAEAQPDIGADRRDDDWEAFDRALIEMLERGLCPTCQEQVVIELGRTNHCLFCGASFTSYVLERAGHDRRS